MAEEWEGREKPSGTSSFLMKEDSFNLLLESGCKIVLSRGEEWNTRNKPSS